MAKFILEIEMAGEAFDDDSNAHLELRRLLAKVSSQVDSVPFLDASQYRILLDINGNTCGAWSIGDSDG